MTHSTKWQSNKVFQKYGGLMHTTTIRIRLLLGSYVKDNKNTL